MQYPFGRVSMEFPDALNIPGLSMDANLCNIPLAEYPRIPLDTPDIPRLSVDVKLYNAPLAEYPWISRIL